MESQALEMGDFTFIERCYMTCGSKKVVPKQWNAPQTNLYELNSFFFDTFFWYINLHGFSPLEWKRPITSNPKYWDHDVL